MNGIESKGLILKPDGSGYIGNRDPAAIGAYLRWRVVKSGELRILHHGEEGEHGDYQAVHYRLMGNRLELSSSLEIGCDELERAKPGSTPIDADQRN